MKTFTKITITAIDKNHEQTTTEYQYIEEAISAFRNNCRSVFGNKIEFTNEDGTVDFLEFSLDTRGLMQLIATNWIQAAACDVARQWRKPNWPRCYWGLWQDGMQFPRPEEVIDAAANFIFATESAQKNCLDRAKKVKARLKLHPLEVYLAQPHHWVPKLSSRPSGR